MKQAIDKELSLTIAKHLDDILELKKRLRGQPMFIPLKYNESYTFNRDFVLTELTKYPNLGEIPSATDNGELKLSITQMGLDLIKSSDGAIYDYLEIRMIPDAKHPLVLPVPLYFRKGMTLQLSNLFITDTTFRLGLIGYYPIKETDRNPITFPRPYFVIHRYSNIAPNTVSSTKIVEIESSEIFTIDKIFVMCITRDTTNSVLIRQDADFTINMNVSGKELTKNDEAIYPWIYFGSPEYPHIIRPRYEEVSGAPMITTITTPNWADGFNRDIYIVWCGIMRYDFSKERLEKRVPKEAAERAQSIVDVI